MGIVVRWCIQNTVDIDRSPEDVFDYVVDLRSELDWDPGVESMEKITDGPLFLLVMKRQERKNMANAKQALERRNDPAG